MLVSNRTLRAYRLPLAAALALLLVCASPRGTALAQEEVTLTIKVAVSDKGTHEPVANAQVEIPRAGKSIKGMNLASINGRTDSDGRWARPGTVFLLRFPHRLRVSAPGYQTSEQELPPDVLRVMFSGNREFYIPVELEKTAAQERPAATPAETDEAGGSRALAFWSYIVTTLTRHALAVVAVLSTLSMAGLWFVGYRLWRYRKGETSLREEVAEIAAKVDRNIRALRASKARDDMLLRADDQRLAAVRDEVRALSQSQEKLKHQILAGLTRLSEVLSEMDARLNHNDEQVSALRKRQDETTKRLEELKRRGF